MLGGTQSLHTNSMDEVFALPTERAARIALRTQQVIAHETGVTNVADPLGGSWFVEALTDELERQAEAVFAHLDEIGGGSMLEGVYTGIDQGYFQERDRRGRLRLRAQSELGPPRRRRRERLPGRQRGRPAADAAHRRRGRGAAAEATLAVRAGRSAEASRPLSARSARTPATRPATSWSAIATAVRAQATVGEIMGALASVFGRWQEVPRV